MKGRLSNEPFVVRPPSQQLSWPPTGTRAQTPHWLPSTNVRHALSRLDPTPPPSLRPSSNLSYLRPAIPVFSQPHRQPHRQPYRQPHRQSNCQPHRREPLSMHSKCTSKNNFAASHASAVGDNADRRRGVPTLQVPFPVERLHELMPSPTSQCSAATDAVRPTGDSSTLVLRCATTPPRPGARLPALKAPTTPQMQQVLTSFRGSHVDAHGLLSNLLPSSVALADACLRGHVGIIPGTAACSAKNDSSSFAMHSSPRDLSRQGSHAAAACEALGDSRAICDAVGEADVSRDSSCRRARKVSFHDANECMLATRTSN